MRSAGLRTVLVATAVTAGAAGALAVAGCDTDGDDEVAAADAPFCDAFGALLTGPLADETTDATDADVLRGAVTDTRGLVADLVEAAPADVEPAATELAADYDATFAVLERYGFDLERVGTEATAEEQATLDAFGAVPAGPGADDPFARLERFVAARCAPDVTLPADLLETTTTSP